MNKDSQLDTDEDIIYLGSFPSQNIRLNSPVIYLLPEYEESSSNIENTNSDNFDILPEHVRINSSIQENTISEGDLSNYSTLFSASPIVSIEFNELIYLIFESKITIKISSPKKK